MNHDVSALNGEFGVMISDVTRADLKDPAFQQKAYDLWSRNGGLLGVRGGDLVDLQPEELVAWSGQRCSAPSNAQRRSRARRKW